MLPLPKYQILSLFFLILVRHINTLHSLSPLLLTSYNKLIPLIEISNHLEKIIKISDSVQYITNINLLKELLHLKRWVVFFTNTSI